MARKTLPEIAEILKDIDFVVLNTKTEAGEIAGRPMSNNRQVEYDGDSWYFVDAESRTFADVSRDPKVSLSVQGKPGLFGKPPVFLTIEGEAELVQDPVELERRWQPELERWWPEGPQTPGLALVKVHATRIHYWDGGDEGELRPWTP
jgi:general stress protein 26